MGSPKVRPISYRPGTERSACTTAKIGFFILAIFKFLSLMINSVSKQKKNRQRLSELEFEVCLHIKQF